MSPTFRATYGGASEILDALRARPGSASISDDAFVKQMPEVSRYKYTNYAYRVHLANHHSIRFAALDEGVLNKEWASDVAFNPLPSR